MGDSIELLSRQDFKEKVFKATNGKCCVPGCSSPAVDAHHVMDRKLWKDGGYYLSNGAALCSKHHLEAEEGKITPTQCMKYMGIKADSIRVPDEISKFLTREEYLEALKEEIIDKWGK